MHWCTVLLKDKIVINYVFIACNIRWDSKISQHCCPLTFAWCLMKNNSCILHSNRSSSRLGNIKQEGNILQDGTHRSCLVYTVDRFNSKGWFICDKMVFLNVFRAFLVKQQAEFKWKDAISRFTISSGSAEALVRWAGKIKHVLIVYSLNNISARSRPNRLCTSMLYSKKK